MQLGGQRGVAVRQRAPQPAGGGVQPPDADVGRVEELRDRAGEVGEDLVGVERGGDEPVDLLQRAQPLGVARRLRVQPRVLDGGGRVRGEALEQREILDAEGRGLVAGAAHRQHAEGAVAQDERLHDEAAHAGGHEARRRVRRARVVVGDDAAALADGQAREALAGGQPFARELLARPGARHQRVILGQRPQGAACLEEAGGALDDQRGQPLGVQHRRQLALDVGEGGDLLPPRALDREQARVLEREGGLIGEGLQQRRLAVGEDAPAAVGDAEGADDHALGTHRHRQHGDVARGAEVRAQVVGHARDRVGERVRRGDRPALDHGATEHADAGWQHVTGLEVLARAPAQRQRGQGTVGLQQPDHRGLRAKQRQHALDRALHHLRHVERLGERPRQPGQLLGLRAPLRGLGVEARVGEGERRLVGEGLRQPRVVLAEEAAALAADGEHADHDVVHDQRHRDGRVVADGGIPLSQRVRLLDARIRGDVGGDDHAPRLRGQARDADASRQHRRRRNPRRAPSGHGDGHEGAGGRLHAEERGRDGREQPAHAVGDPLAHDLGIEGTGEEAREIGQRAHAVGLLGGLADEPRVLDGDDRLPRERLGQLLVARAEGPPRAEGEHPDGPPADLQRHTEERRVAEASDGGELRGRNVGHRRDVEHEGVARREHLAGEALRGLDPLLQHRLAGRARGAGQHEVVPLEQPEAGVVHVEQPCRLLGDGGQQRPRRERHAGAESLSGVPRRGGA